MFCFLLGYGDLQDCVFILKKDKNLSNKNKINYSF